MLARMIYRQLRFPVFREVWCPARNVGMVSAGEAWRHIPAKLAAERTGCGIVTELAAPLDIDPAEGAFCHRQLGVIVEYGKLQGTLDLAQQQENWGRVAEGAAKVLRYV